MSIQDSVLGAPITREAAGAIVERLAAAKSRRSVDDAMAIYHPEGVLLCPPFRSRAEGATEIRRAVERFFTLFPDYAVDLDGHAIDGDRLVAWGQVGLTLAHTFTDAVPNGRRATIPVFILFRFRDDRVVWESFHFDLADLARQSGVATTDLEGPR